MANPVGEIEQRTKAILKRRGALDLAPDVRMTRPSRVRRN
ncbi:hypothetical protein ACVWXN_010224 [Bradyrhizobium sp. i1.4.4]